MNAILVLLRKDIAQFRRDRTSVVLALVVPFALIYLFGQIFGVNRSDAGPSAVPLAVVNASAAPGARDLVDALKQEKTFRLITTTVGENGAQRPLTEPDLRPLMRADKFRFALVLPADFSSADRFGLKLKLYDDPRNSIEAQTVSGLLQKAIFTQTPRLLGASMQNQARRLIGDERTAAFDHRVASAVADSFGGDPEAIYQRMRDGEWGAPASAAGAGGSGGTQDFLSRLVSIDRIQVAGREVKSPQATQLVGGWAIQFLLFALMASATSLFYEKDYGIFQRILSGPVSRSAVLLSKFLYGMLLGLLQLLVLFAAGRVIFHIEIWPYFLPLAVVCAFAAAACSGFGMLLAALARSPEAARGLATFVILIMCALGGAWFPVSFMPEFIQQFSRCTLVYWSMEGFVQVLWVHASWLELLPTLGILAGMAALLLGAAWWGFSRGNVFD